MGIIYELRHNDRVIGGLDLASIKKAIKFYRQFVIGDLRPTDVKTAEMCKLVENVSRDSSIAFANELSVIDDTTEINVWDMRLANKHPRINIFQPATGVGWHCIVVAPPIIVSGFKKDQRC
jgi:UDP-N-acetyl-D-mannosaminuronic acid dehydrogenase